MGIIESPFLWIGILSGGIFFLFIWNVFLTHSLSRIKKHSEIFYSGVKANNLETSIYEHMQRTKGLEKDLKELADFSNKVYILAGKSTHKIGLIRFNPFKDVGGDQSFALALLDREKTGVVISSLYTREGTRIYAKPVHKNLSLEGYSFTEEEKEAIERASVKKIEGFSQASS